MSTIRGQPHHRSPLAGTGFTFAASGPIAGLWGGASRCEDLGFEGVQVQRAGKKETLDFVHLLTSQVVHLTVGLDAFGEGPQAEVLAELDEGADDRPGCWGGDDPVGEGTVDL